MQSDLLQSSGAGQALQAVAKSYGISSGQLDQILGTVMPALTQRIERNTLSRGGLSDLVEQLGHPEHARALADPGYAASPAGTAAGIGALDNVFGDKAISRSVASQAALSSGVQQAIIQKLLPIIASLVMGALAKNGGIGDILKKLPDVLGGGGGSGGASPFPSPQRRQASPAPAPQDPDLGGLGDILKRIPGFPGSDQQATAPQSAPQQPRQSSPWPQQQAPQPQNDGTGFGGAGGGGAPLPIPGDRIPGINAPAADNSPWGNLPDVIRQGGQQVDGNDLGKVVREKIGTQLGFPNSGILKWIIGYLVYRWGWGILKRILSRVVTGR